MSDTRSASLVDVLIAAQEQVESQEVMGKVKQKEEACILAELIMSVFELSPRGVIGPKSMLVAWLLGNYRETSAPTLVEAMIESVVYELGG